MEHLTREAGTLQRQLEVARDEAVELKLRVADLEAELMEERTSKATK